MLITWSPYSGTAGKADGPCALSNYMDAEVVRKRLSNGRVADVMRNPVPEILLGDAAQLRMAIRSSTCTHRYSSCVLSFTKDDIDVDAFNAGDPDARFATDLALRLWIDTALAGVPTDLQPPIYATTHTHTGALEINIAVPRWIMGPDGRQRGFNPAPPEKGHATWDAFRDVLNHRFGWVDPECPDRRRALSLPDWMLKVDAESHRAGVEPERGSWREITDLILTQVSAGAIRNRAGLLGWIEDSAPETGFILHTARRKSITIGPVGAKPADRLRLRGAVFEDSFGRLDGEVAASPIIVEREERRQVLSSAVDRLQIQWERRAAFNRSRFGLDQWPPQEFSAARYQTMSGGDVPLIIPGKHHLYCLSTGAASHDTETDTDGARLARYIGPNGKGGADARPGPDREDRRLDAAASATRGLCRELAQLAEPLSAKGLFDAVTARLMQLATAIRSRLTLKGIAAALPDTLLQTLADTHSALEAYNGPNTDDIVTGQSDRTAPEGADPAHPTLARASGGRLRRDDGASRRGYRRAGSDRIHDAENSKDYERGAQHPVAGARSAAEGHHPKAGSTDADADRSAQLVGRASAPDSRASLLRHLRREVLKVDRSADIRLQFTQGPVAWPPRLELVFARENGVRPRLLNSTNSTCRIICASASAVKIRPVLKRAVEDGWVSGIDFDENVPDNLPIRSDKLLNSVQENVQHNRAGTMSTDVAMSDDAKDQEEGSVLGIG